MLAFSDGVSLPYLPPDPEVNPNVESPTFSRFRILGRQVHRQLKQYQKKPSDSKEATLGLKSNKFLLPAFYLYSMERMKDRYSFVQRMKSNKQIRKTADHSLVAEDECPIFNLSDNPQGGYPASMPPNLATCGISSVGDRTSLIRRGRYALNLNDTSTLSEDRDKSSQSYGPEKAKKQVAVDYKDSWAYVRPRDGEFLVGAVGSQDGMDDSDHGTGLTGMTAAKNNTTTTKADLIPSHTNSGDSSKEKEVVRFSFGVSFDGNTIDPVRAEEWRVVIEGLLEPGSRERNITHFSLKSVEGNGLDKVPGQLKGAKL
jgi:hypothetical protein